MLWTCQWTTKGIPVSLHRSGRRSPWIIASISGEIGNRWVLQPVPRTVRRHMTREETARTLWNPWITVTETWTRASGHMAKSLIEANRAATAAFGLSRSKNGNAETPIDGMSYRDPDWDVELSADSYESFGVGDRVTFTKQITEVDVENFAQASGDTNRLHLEADFGEASRFGTRIVHGTLIGGLISAALARLPLLTIYLSQDLEFLRPVEIGETLTAVCEVREDLGDRRYRLQTDVQNVDGDPVIQGEAIVLIDDLPAQS